ncbi:acyltransferase family protein [Bradyrhizobium roseum]|uniref:acyltransferase family protein n=1 Tax=Bradyrhizobium roseum TaxID=3056648 RepID=UPI0026180581|nr:acyltransferase [Bradyrhizobium roseus]WKA31266.1 acyltransferase [Bradyrhizobium roseus]
MTLDLLRVVAAQMVCVGHGIAFFMPPWRPSELPLMQNVGVLIFFVLSGFLISFTLIERSKQPSYGFGTFLLDRFARIYSGLIPALLFVVIVDGIVIYVFNERAFAAFYSGKTFVANLFMLEAYRGVLSSYLRWPPFGSASPLWTLAIEWHIYIFVAAVFFIWARPRQRLIMIIVAIIFCQVPLHYLRGAYQQDGVGMGLFSLWLAGTFVLLTLRMVQLPYWASLTLALGAAVCFFLVTKARLEYNILTYATVVIFLFAVLAASQSSRLLTSKPVARFIKFMADYSFTLYLVHYSIMFAVFLIRPERNFYIFAIMVLIANIVAIAIAVPTEMRHREFARLLTTAADRYIGRYKLQK